MCVAGSAAARGYSSAGKVATSASSDEIPPCTLAPALAAELEGVPVATVIPHLDPRTERGWPPFSLGARLPRTALGRRLWGGLSRVTDAGLERGRRELNETRRRLGLGPLARVHGGISSPLALVATFPALEYPRAVALPATHTVGPLLWEPPADDVALPPGDDPLVLVAPSTSQDPSHQLLRATLRGLADAPVRVLAAWNRRPLGEPIDVPANARLVDWLSYARVMPLCDVVVCHGGHGTLARALASGCAVVIVPAAGDMNESAARIDWAGVGVRRPPPPLRARPGAPGRRARAGRAAGCASARASWRHGGARTTRPRGPRS